MSKKPNQSQEEKGEDEDEVHVNTLIDKTTKVLSDLHELELTFSRVKNEAQETLRNLMRRKFNS